MKKVLVVDDERSIVTYLAAVLEDNGFATCSAADGIEALEVARREKPDLVCVDVMMPKRSGISFYEQLRRDGELGRVPVIFVSAYNHVRDLRDPVAFRKIVADPAIAQPERCLEKPVAVPEFVAAVEALIGKGDAGPGRT